MVNTELEPNPDLREKRVAPSQYRYNCLTLIKTSKFSQSLGAPLYKNR